MNNRIPHTRSLPILTIALLAGLAPRAAHAQEGEGSGEDLIIDDIVITGAFEPEETTGGAVSVVTEEQLEQLRHTDPQAVLQQVPGVYVRQEDGYGLRPNIGIRGANSDRSKKVTLMEDGVLFGPAPYSAPAAYFFPLMYRMGGVEVWMGPSAIVFGPQTIGGAVNLLSREIPEEREGLIDVAGGSDRFLRGYARYGASNDFGGYLIELIHQHSNGFKDLDGGGNTGFDRTEAVVRGRLTLQDTEFTHQSLELRLGYSREVSNETYLGLSDADFVQNPYRRYRASRLDEMDWDRTEARLTHTVELIERGTITTQLYRHDFSRNWYKVNRFAGGPDLADVLASPDSGINQLYYAILTGSEDSSTPEENLGVGGNDRTFISQGIQSTFNFELGRTGEIEHRLTAGVRLHHDAIIRNHSEDTYALVGGDPRRTEDDRVITAHNRGDSIALADFVTWELGWRGLTLSPGVRTELIFTSFNDRLSDEQIDDSQFVALPGLGAHYAITETFGVLAGVHQGFSPVSPGQAEGTDPERSTNYEAGLRWLDDERSARAELVGFYNDYQNLTGECTFSTGCPESLLDRQFNAGSARIMGADASFAMPIELPSRFSLPVRVAYTLTMTEFRESFASENPQFGEVERGDELPYVPQHQASATVGIARDSWAVNFGATYTDSMRETAGSGQPAADEKTEAYAMLDVMAQYEVIDGLTIYARGENLNGATPIASRLPFGARPAKPRMAQAGVSWEF